MSDQKTRELTALREEAKSLGIKSSSVMGHDRLVAEIAKAKGGSNQNKETLPGDQDIPGANQEVKPVKPVKTFILQEDTFLYHETELPKVFKAGSEVPDGWSVANRRLWKHDDYGKWMRNDDNS